MEYLFLRLYGANLSSRSRNTPDLACRDAIAQSVFALIVPVAAIATGLVAGVVRLDQTSFRDWARGIGIVVVIVLTISVQRFRGYAQTPSAADAFRTKAVCRWTWAIFFLLPLIGIGIYAAILDVLPQ